MILDFQNYRAEKEKHRFLKKIEDSEDGKGLAEKILGAKTPEAAKELADLIEKERGKIEELARKDGLTGVNNRMSFDERIEKEFSRAERYQHKMSLIMVDIDHFKEVNDTLGHQAGDEVIKKLAEIMRDVFRESDIIARYGGEEFAIILPEVDNGEAVKAGERLREAVEKKLKTFIKEKYGEKADNIAGTVSIGVVSKNECKNTKEMIERSDEGLYLAKQRGRNRVVNWNREHKRLGEREAIEITVQEMKKSPKEKQKDTIKELLKKNPSKEAQLEILRELLSELEEE